MRLQTLIFSKDRACQLDLLLRSIRDYFDYGEIAPVVLYRASQPVYARGYAKLRQRFPEVGFMDESSYSGTFRETVLGLLNPAVPLTMCLVDDDLFKAPCSVSDRVFEGFHDSPELLCISLRLGVHIDYCYTLDTPTPPPPLDEDCTWAWAGCAGDWGYPMSLDGHIFRTADLLPLLQTLHYANPNLLEYQLARTPLPQPGMCCYAQSRIVNLPLNRVQAVFPNRCGEVDPAELNRVYLEEDRQIDLEPFRGWVNHSAHQEHSIRLVSLP